MPFKCDECKIFYKKKPSYATKCPKCENSVFFVESNIDGYRVYGDSEFVEGRCVACTRRASEKTSFKLKEPMNFSERQASDRIHKKCYEEADEIEKTWYKLIDKKDD